MRCSTHILRPVSHDNLKKDLHRIFISAQHLDGLIRDVLDLASSDMGQLKLVSEPFNMATIVEAVSAIGEQLAWIRACPGESKSSNLASRVGRSYAAQAGSVEPCQ